MLKNNLKTVRKIKGNDKGFTLLEVIMAVAILTVGLLGVASLQISAMRNNSMSMEYSESTERVQDTVEKLLNKDFDDTDLDDTKPVGAPDGTAGLDNDTEATADHFIDGSLDGSLYDIYWNVADDQVWNGVSWRTVNGVKTIRVIVKWEDRGKLRDYSFDILRNRI